MSSNKSYNYYKLPIGNTYKAGDDIVIKVIPLDYFSDPDIFISKVSPIPYIIPSIDQ
jgi:hypothetical protein